MIRVLIHTDLPDPVAPAIRRCGILPISATTVFPPISLPTANASSDGNSRNSFVSNRSRSMTGLLVAFGTSIPTAAFPGIGASIRISAAARFSLISSVSPTILLTFTPCSGCSSYRVTVGPQLTLVIVTLTPKLCSVVCNFIAVSRRCASESPETFRSPRFRKSSGGKIYSFFTGSFVISCWIFSIPFAISSCEERDFLVRVVFSACAAGTSSDCSDTSGSACISSFVTGFNSCTSNGRSCCIA